MEKNVKLVYLSCVGISYSSNIDTVLVRKVRIGMEVEGDKLGVRA